MWERQREVDRARQTLQAADEGLIEPEEVATSGAAA
jgi:hypothetical protein